MALAATFPPFRALDQCSLRWCSPVKGCRALATSPAAKIAGRVRAQRGVGEDAVLQPDARGRSEGDLRDNAHRHDHQIRRQDLAGVRDDAGHPPGLPRDFRGRGRKPEPHALGLVQRAEESAQLRADRGAQRHLLEPQQGDGVAVGAGGGGQFHPDPARADHHHVPAALGEAGRAGGGCPPPSGKCVTPSSPLPGKGSERGLDPVASSREPYSSRPPSRQAHGAGGRIDPGDRNAQPELDVVLPVPAAPAPRAGPPRRPCRAGTPSTAAGAGRDGAASAASRTTGPVKPSARSVLAAVAPASPPPTITMSSTAICARFLRPALPVRRSRRRRPPGILKAVFLTLEAGGGGVKGFWARIRRGDRMDPQSLC